MPIANLTTIYSFSSEDPHWPASNLLTKISKKWRCKIAGEQKAFVCFELDKPSVITGIDIGNEYSAYITVQVGRRGCRDEDFTELVLASSFMTSAESRNSTNVNRVRCFHKGALIASVAPDKWELVRFVCTQPYSKQYQFGMSFVKLHIAADSMDTAKPKPLVPDQFLATSSSTIASSASPFAKFKMRAESSDSESENASSLFNRWKMTKGKDTIGQGGTTSAAAAIRDSASSSSLLQTATPIPSKPRFQPSTSRTTSIAANPKKDENDIGSDEEKPKRVDRNRMALMYDSDDEKPNENLEKKLQHDIAEREKAKSKTATKGTDKANVKKSDDKELSRTEKRISEKFKDFLCEDSSKPSGSLTETLKTPKPSTSGVPKPDRFSPFASTSSRKRSLLSEETSSETNREESPLKKAKVAKRIEKDIVYKPFGKLLDGVVLVISGIQNPDRGHIRDKALRMGAKYKSDWDDSCTHLICAFKNTPKYNQVHGHGKIIKKEWIGACYDAKKRFPWRRFALDSAEKAKPESEDEIDDLARKPKAPVKQPSPKPIEDDDVVAIEAAPVVPLDISDASDSETDNRYVQKSDYDEKPAKNEILSSGSDTEDEIERVQQKNNARPAAKRTAEIVSDAANDDPYDKSTDDERPVVAINGDSSKRSVTPLPEFFAGKKFYLSQNLGSVDTIKLTNFINVYGGKIIINAAEANYILSAKAKQLPSDFAGEVVRALWVYECNDLECLLPTTRYRFG